jgi:hypothetical protein
MSLFRKIQRPVLPVLLCLLLALSVLTVQAQGLAPAAGAGDKDGAGAAASWPDLAIDAGIGSPPPSGFAVVYMFTGVANESDNGNDEATSINCTNYSNSAAVEVRVEVYGANPADLYAANQVINPGATRTWSTQSIEAYNDGTILPSVDYIFQGSGRILTRQHRQVICSAQVLDADVDPPMYAARLTMYDHLGRVAKSVRFIHLPIIAR